MFLVLFFFSFFVLHLLWVHTGDALVHALLLRSERGCCSVTQHQVSARRSACTHEKEDLTTSRFVRVIYNSNIVYNRVGIVSSLDFFVWLLFFFFFFFLNISALILAVDHLCVFAVFFF